MFALAVVGFLVAFGLVLTDHRKAALCAALVLAVACVGFYFSHSYHVDWPW